MRDRRDDPNLKLLLSNVEEPNPDLINEAFEEIKNKYKRDFSEALSNPLAYKHAFLIHAKRLPKLHAYKFDQNNEFYLEEINSPEELSSVYSDIVAKTVISSVWGWFLEVGLHHRWQEQANRESADINTEIEAAVRLGERLDAALSGKYDGLSLYSDESVAAARRFVDGVKTVSQFRKTNSKPQRRGTGREDVFRSHFIREIYRRWSNMHGAPRFTPLKKEDADKPMDFMEFSGIAWSEGLRLGEPITFRGAVTKVAQRERWTDPDWHAFLKGQAAPPLA